MKINGMDFLNSFHGCQVIDYCMVKRFKGQLEGKNRYFYGAAVTEIVGSILSMVLLFHMFTAIIFSKPVPRLSAFAFLFCVIAMIVAKVYYEKNSFVIAEYTLRIENTFSEVDKETIKQEFYLKRINHQNNDSDDFFVAYPKTKGGVE